MLPVRGVNASPKVNKMKTLVKVIIYQAIAIALYIANAIGNLPHKPSNFALEWELGPVTGWEYTVWAIRMVLQQITLP